MFFNLNKFSNSVFTWELSTVKARLEKHASEYHIKSDLTESKTSKIDSYERTCEIFLMSQENVNSWQVYFLHNFVMKSDIEIKLNDNEPQTMYRS